MCKASAQVELTAAGIFHNVEFGPISCGAGPSVGGRRTSKKEEEGRRNRSRKGGSFRELDLWVAISRLLRHTCIGVSTILRGAGSCTASTIVTKIRFIAACVW